MTPRVSLAELAAADIQLRPAEAVTVVAEVCRQHGRGEIPAIPAPGLIRVTFDGQVVAQGPMAREEASVSRAGHLLNDLLPGLDAPGDYRASGGLRLVVARALGTLDLPPYASLDDFCAALARFADPNPAATARGLFRRVAETAEGEPQPVTALARSGPQGMAIGAPVRRRARSGLAASARYVAVAALLALATFGIVMGSAQGTQGGYPARAQGSNAPARVAVPVEPSAAVASAATAAAQTPAPGLKSRATTRPRTRPAPQPRRPAPGREARPVATSAVVAAADLEPPAAGGPQARPAPQPRRPAARVRSFFNRELFRIVIK